MQWTQALVLLMWSVVAERSSAMDSSSGVVNVECCGRAV